MNARYYFKITFLPFDCNSSFLIGRCLKILHGFSKRNEINDIGVTFPEWDDSGPGKTLGFVSVSLSHLNLLIEQQYFLEMQKLKYFDISDIKQILGTTHQEVTFIRNQAIDQISAKSIQRQINRSKKRAESRGDIYNPKVETKKNLTFQLFHKIPMSSSSSGFNFSLSIQCVKMDETLNDRFSSYGLSNKTNFVSSVPKHLP
ncbi:type I-F CRISPR-associated endoribonuclease Cas6/Csy4 [Paraglaciecola hydrolytica]|uniref:Uncharacterized protein n=1 Tax=Paraglaciecola hydrolytica TaxID=1799789 RepID=A0A135ZYI0_9ALTE|nr:type I-F CRISPR-associated endoribonuclease Cas6/Csy4 [Paraglaciecola hydrolytica]KXI28035.1 hypothetical protein AX660_16725 [Paraglaciecola hydrolytica]